MPTSKTRVNISLSENAKTVLFRLARRDQVPYATKAARLLELALELEEDRVWESLAASRDDKKSRYISHAKAWK